VTKQAHPVVDRRPNFAKARCIGAPPEVFFPTMYFKGSKVSRKQLAEARVYCAECPIQSECLEYACRTDSVGIWGGVVLSEHLARKLRDRNGWTLQREVVADTR